MPISYYSGDDYGEYELYDTDWGLFKLIRCKKESKCMCCEKKICKNNYCLGKGYTKVCISCSDKVIDNFAKSLKDYIAEATELKEIIKKDIEHIKKVNLANSL